MKQKTECVWLSLPVFFALAQEEGGGHFKCQCFEFKQSLKGYAEICLVFFFVEICF